MPDWWLGDGRQIRVERLPTHFGEMRMTVRGTAEGVEIDMDRPTRNPPKRIILTLPTSRPLLNALDGVDIATMPRHELRSRTGMVLQETWLFEGTIRENIGYGCLDASDTAL